MTATTSVNRLSSEGRLSRSGRGTDTAGRKARVEADFASLVLRLLLDEEAPLCDIDLPAWATLLRVAQRNAVLLRLAERLGRRRVPLPAFFADAVAHEQRRIRAAIEVIQTISRACAANGIDFLLPKVAQHLPDMGDDVDLLVLSRDREVDRCITEALQVTAARSDLSSRLAGSATYGIAGAPTLDIQHGRLGTVGEHTGFPADLVRHRRLVLVDGVEIFVASANDQLVLQGLQRVYGRLGIQLADVVYTMTSTQRDALDWDYIICTAHRVGVLAGLSCYLSYVEQIHRSLYHRDLLPAPVGAQLSGRGWGRVEFRGSQFRYPLLRVNGRLYIGQLGRQVAAGHWEAAGRLCLIPVVGIVRATRRLTRRWAGKVRA
jgi:hypothetical protein